MKTLTFAVIAAAALTAVHAQTCATVCTDVIAPVCGSDGVTYDNKCLFNKHKCETNDDKLTIVSNGECPAAPVCASVCADVIAPVCGSDGVTYRNECLFDKHKCESNDGQLTIVSQGECPATLATQSCGGTCSDVVQPVCGTDGVTYNNACELYAANCQFNNVTVAADGECGACVPTECPDVVFRVCGSDQVTYMNECFLNNAKCADPSLTLAHYGKCSRMITK